MNKIEIIAEIGWNHMGDNTLAKEMIKSAKENGADTVKFQYWDPAHLKSGVWDTDGRREIYNKAALTEEKVIELKKDSNTELVISNLYKKTTLQTNFGGIFFSLLIKGKPIQLNLREYLNYFLEFREETIRKEQIFF